ncbi:ferritin [Corynebacterium anserum]|uniref:Ferritin n=1 Tax=Corynebacterium anserum TaxID=2684406 RepID=A0A7G7YME6_9CORY|nr:ferritin [Corynebacterium anserum]MBC2681029.1 ferritin [Corynebacterium anserum]QNH95666.1 ferritin [Corynebacterium anserum]
MSINKKFAKQLNQQVIAEHEAALIYTQLAYELDRLSFSGMRDWMFEQAKEEREHAQKFAQHLLDRGERVQLGTVNVPAIKISSPLEAFEASLAHEEKVSELIRELARTADKVGDIDSRSLLNWFLDEQIEEESTVGEIIDRIKIVGTDGSGLLRIDQELGSRPDSE